MISPDSPEYIDIVELNKMYMDVLLSAYLDKLHVFRAEAFLAISGCGAFKATEGWGWAVYDNSLEDGQLAVAGTKTTLLHYAAFRPEIGDTSNAPNIRIITNELVVFEDVVQVLTQDARVEDTGESIYLPSALDIDTQLNEEGDVKEGVPAVIFQIADAGGVACSPNIDLPPSYLDACYPNLEVVALQEGLPSMHPFGQGSKVEDLSYALDMAGQLLREVSRLEPLVSSAA